MKRPMRERKQSTPSLWTFADSDGGEPGCSPLKWALEGSVRSASVGR